MTLPELRARRRENRRRMKTASPTVRTIREEIDNVYGQMIALLKSRPL